MAHVYGIIETSNSDLKKTYEYATAPIEAGYCVELDANGKIIKALGTKNIEGVVIGEGGTTNTTAKHQTIAVHGAVISCIYAGAVDYTPGNDAFVDVAGKVATTGTIKVGTFANKQRDGAICYIVRL